MPDAPLILGVSGLRGIAGESLTPGVVRRFASAFGGWLGERSGAPVVALGRDGRAGGREIADAVSFALRAGGVRVIDLGVATTPTVGVAVEELSCSGGLIVTASHNPQRWNGLKCLIAEEDRGSGRLLAVAPPASCAREIIARFEAGEDAPGGDSRAEITACTDASEVHVGHVIGALRGLFGRGAERRFRVVLDSVNASGAAGGRMLLERLGCELSHVNDSDSGVFPHEPEPTREHLRDLCAQVRRSGADAGFAQDPDADRLAIVDERGEYVGEEYTLALCAVSLLSAREPSASRGVLVANLSTSRMIDDIGAAHGARVVRTPVGEANVVEAMVRLREEGEHVLLGGEGNGGVIWPEVVHVRDSLSAIGLTLALMARTGRPLSGLVEDVNALAGAPGGYAIEKRKVPIRARAAAEPCVEAVARHWGGARLDRRDGVRVDLDERRAWLHVRPSNTEPIVRLIAEAPSAGEARRLLDEAERVIENK